MKIFIKIVLSIIALMTISCSSVRKQTKKELDVKSGNDITVLNGCYNDNSPKAVSLFRLLSNSKEQFDTTFTKYNLCISAIDNRHIQVKLYQDGSITSTQVIKGKYNEGYFKKRRWRSKFMVGPIYWSLVDQLTYLGITKENELAVIFTTGGQLFILFFPFMAAQGGDVITKYSWTR